MISPYISSAARTVAKFRGYPCKKCWKAVVEILKYLERTKGLGIAFGGRGYSETRVRAYANSDHATCRDSDRSVKQGVVRFIRGAVR